MSKLPSKPKISDAQKDALKALHAAGLTGVVQRNGRVLAAGEFLKCSPVTILNLILEGYLECTTDGRRRVSLTETGWRAIGIKF